MNLPVTFINADGREAGGVMDQETAYQLALEAKRRSMESGYQSNGIHAIDPAILEKVRREHEQKQAKE